MTTTINLTDRNYQLFDLLVPMPPEKNSEKQPPMLRTFAGGVWMSDDFNDKLPMGFWLGDDHNC